VGSSCETADFFYLEKIQPKIEKYNIDIRTVQNDVKYNSFNFTISQIFPFKEYFNDVENLFSGNCFLPLYFLKHHVYVIGEWKTDLYVAEGCLNHIKNIFIELVDYRFFSKISLYYLFDFK
jgi:hypothetical protein